MKHKHSIFLVFLLFFILFSQFSYGQEKNGPSRISKLQLVAKVPSLAQQLDRGTFVKSNTRGEKQEINPKRRGANTTVPGKGFPKNGDPLVDHSKKAINRSYQPQPIRVFDAHISTNADPVPSDPTGAVGSNHYVAAWNTAFRIFDKNGNPLIAEASLSTLFPDNTAGDPIVLYDAAADRFIITQFEDKDDNEDFDSGLNIAISAGPDPVNSGWYIYTAGFETGAFPDYPKYSIWRDGYYITSNIETNPNRDPDATGANVFVMQRDSMLVGGSPGFLSFALPGLQRNSFYSPQFFNVGYDELPESGGASLVFMQDDAWAGIDDDHLNVWTVNVNWQTPENSSVTEPEIIPTAPFKSVFDGGSFENLSQPSGPDIDALQATIMNQAQFRAFLGYNSAVFNFVVDVAGDDEEQAGIRWYELRQSAAGQPWSIFQEGTYVSPDGQNAFAASMVQDQNGSIGMGFTTVSTKNMIAINYTGRYSNDAAGTMSIPQTLIAQSTANDPFSRYADYTHMTLDPDDEETMWFISEYFGPELRDVVGVFKLQPDFDKDVQVAEILSPKEGTLTSTEEISIQIRNAGRIPQGNFDVSYQIDNGALFTETFTGNLAFNETAVFSFSQMADLSAVGQTYQITTKTELNGDQYPENDAEIASVLHIPGRDVGVSAIIAPTTKGGQTSSEQVTVAITNYGGLPQNDIPVRYTLNDGLVVNEIAPGKLNPDATANYTFDQTADLSALGNYRFFASTALSGDAIPENDSIAKTVSNFYCSPGSNCRDYDDGVTRIDFAEINMPTQCTADGYANNTEVDFVVDLVDETSPSGTLQMGYENSAYVIFVDFDKNGAFEADERVASGSVSASNSDEDFTLDLPDDVITGSYRMRIRGKDINEPGDLNDPCGFLDFGRTNDFTLTLFDSSIVRGIPLEDGELVILTENYKQFGILLRDTDFEDDMILNVFTITGQKLVQNRIESEKGNYVYDLDMSYAATGIYIVRIGTEEKGIVKNIFVR